MSVTGWVMLKLTVSANRPLKIEVALFPAVGIGIARAFDMSNYIENRRKRAFARIYLTAVALSSRKVWLLASVWMLAVIAVLPVICHWAPRPDTGYATKLRIGYWIGLAVFSGIYTLESRRLSRSNAFVVAFVVLLATCITNTVHRFNVDDATNYFPEPNRVWQARHHSLVAELSTRPLMPPHSARFLPDSVVRWLEMSGMSYEVGRDLYRLLFMLLLFYSIFRYARLYTTYLGALLAVLLVALIYPISFQHYAGQLTDPMSHLSFILALTFLEKGDFAFLLSTLLIGSLAKESVLVLTGYYIIFRRADQRYIWKACTLVGGSMFSYFGVRWYILHRGMQYEDVSGVSFAHVSANWAAIDIWLIQLCLTAGALMPFLAIAWNETPRSLRRSALYLFPTLFLSSLFFSWLAESRNFMPVVFVLAVVTADYLVREFTTNDNISVNASLDHG